MSLASKVGRGCAGRGPRPRRGGRLRSFMQPGVVVNFRRARPYVSCPALPMRVSHERAAMHAAVPGALVRAVLGDAPGPAFVLLSTTSRKHGRPTRFRRLLSANPSGSAPTCGAARQIRDGRRAPAGQPPPTSLPQPIFATTTNDRGENHAGKSSPWVLIPLFLVAHPASATRRLPVA